MLPWFSSMKLRGLETPEFCSLPCRVTAAWMLSGSCCWSPVASLQTLRIFNFWLFHWLFFLCVLGSTPAVLFLVSSLFLRPSPPLLQPPSSPSVGGGSLVLPLSASVHLSDRTDGEPRLEPGRHPGGGHASLVQQVHARVSVGPHHAVRAEGHPGPEGHERERQQLRGAGLLHLRHGRGAFTHSHSWSFSK